MSFLFLFPFLTMHFHCPHCAYTSAYAENHSQINICVQLFEHRHSLRAQEDSGITRPSGRTLPDQEVQAKWPVKWLNQLQNYMFDCTTCTYKPTNTSILNTIKTCQIFQCLDDICSLSVRTNGLHMLNTFECNHVVPSISWDLKIPYFLQFVVILALTPDSYLNTT